MDTLWSWILLFFPAHSCERILQGSLVIALLVLIDIISMILLHQYVHRPFFQSEVWCAGIYNIAILTLSIFNSLVLGANINDHLRPSYNFLQRPTYLPSMHVNDFRVIRRNLFFLIINIVVITFVITLPPMDSLRNHWYALMAPQLTGLGMRTCDTNPPPWQQVELVTIVPSELCLLSRTSEREPWTAVLPRAFYAAGVQPIEPQANTQQVSMIALSSQNPAVNTVIQQCDATQCIARMNLNVFGQTYILVTDQPRAIPLVKVSSTSSQSLEFLRPQRVAGFMVYRIDQTGITSVTTPADDIHAQCMRQ